MPLHSPEETFDTDVLVVGAGPTGLTLAALTARGVRTTLVDRQAEGDNTSRAAVVHARTLEVLEPLGDVTPTLVARGLCLQRFTIRDRARVRVQIGFDRLPTRYPFTLMISQADTERVLLALRQEAAPPTPPAADCRQLAGSPPMDADLSLQMSSAAPR